MIIADNPCRFEHKEKGVIDLTSVASTDGKAAFPDISPSAGSNYIYSYNPCKPFTEGDKCKEVAVCQVSRDKQLTFILGKQDSAKWDAGAGAGTNPSIAYSYELKKVFVELACSESTVGELDALGEDPTNTYKFRLTHKCACWNGCKKEASSGGMSGGAIFIIILVSLFGLYFIVFAIINGVYYKRRGADLIAHRTFWVATPVYVKDGVMYLFHRVTGRRSGEYQKV